MQRSADAVHLKGTRNENHMKHTIKCFAAFSLLVLLLEGCKKKIPVAEIDRLPPATQEGRNTFGCLVNGKVFVPGDRYFGMVTPLSCSYYTQDKMNYVKGSLFLQGITMLGNEGIGSLAIQKMDVYSTGTYSLPFVPCSTNYRCDATFLHMNQSGDYLSEGGQMTITRLDTLNRIVSGTFYMTLKGTNGKTYTVTDGRFDLKMVP